MSLPLVVLVHGCTQGPSGWRRLQGALTALGVRSLAVDLRPQDYDGAGSMECARHITDACADEERVVLVGTSCSGILTPVVATLRPVERLVFICAGLPDIGRSASDQIAQDGVLHDDWMSWPGQSDSEEAARRFMFNDCEGAVLREALSTVRLFLPTKAYDEVTPLTSWPDVPCTHVLGTMDRIINQEWARRVVPERLGVRPIEVDTGHCPQNSQPEMLARLIAGILRSSSRARTGAATALASDFAVTRTVAQGASSLSGRM